MLEGLLDRSFHSFPKSWLEVYHDVTCQDCPAQGGASTVRPAKICQAETEALETWCLSPLRECETLDYDSFEQNVVASINRKVRGVDAYEQHTCVIILILLVWATGSIY